MAGCMLAAVLALGTAAASACTPPRPFDIALELAATVDGGGAVVPGSRGQLLFTASNLRQGFPEGFEVRQAPFAAVPGQVPPIRLSTAAGSDCVVEDRQVELNGQPARLQAAVAPRDRNLPWPRSCRVDYEVMPDAAAAQVVRYTLVLQDFCGIDVNGSNNTADFPFGVVPPVAPASPVPLAAWPLLLLVLAMLAAGRRVRSGRRQPQRR